MRDVRYAVRGLLNTPALAAVVVISIGVAIAANTTVFSLVDAVLLRALPFRDAGRLAILWTTNSLNGATEQNTSVANVEDWRTRSRSFDELAIYREGDGPLMQPSQPSSETEWIDYAWASDNFFALLGRSAAIGRVFDSSDAGGGRATAVISHQLWQRRFGGSTAVLGQRLSIGGFAVEIVGVMPRDFWFPTRAVQVWMPARINPRWRGSEPDRRLRFGAVLGRLRRGVAVEYAQAEMTGIARQLTDAYPEANADLGIHIVPLLAQINGASVPFMLMLLSGAVVCLLLIACANAASLLLARAIARRREVALHAALGAGRGRIVRQLLTESLLLSCVAGGVGLLLAWIGVRAVAVLTPGQIVRVQDARIDGLVLSFSAGMSVFTGLVFGLVPALWIVRDDAMSALGTTRNAAGGRSGRWLGRSCVIGQFALAVTLLATAGLLVRSLVAIQSVDSGFGDRTVVTGLLQFQTSLPRASRVELYRQSFERIRQIPGVRAAGAVSTMFWSAPVASFGLRAVDGQPPLPRAQWDALAWTTVSGEYFQALGVPLLQGRLFDENDRANSPRVVLINETMARRYWPNEKAVGKRIKGFDARGAQDDWVTVVGVVRDVRSRGLERAAMAQIFEAQAQSLDETANLVVSAQASLGIAASLRETIREVDRTAVLSDVATLDERFDEQTARRRFETYVLSAFAAVALVLALAGIFGMMHYSVVQRRQELGIRLAVGARPASVLALILREGISMAVAGMALGVAGSLVVSRSVSSLLFGVAPTDPLTFALVCATLTAAALVGCSLPAWRASRVDPLSVLRAD